jgi:hypothetical protein
MRGAAFQGIMQLKPSLSTHPDSTAQATNQLKLANCKNEAKARRARRHLKAGTRSLPDLSHVHACYAHGSLARPSSMNACHREVGLGKP